MPCNKEDQWTEKELPDLAGYVIIVTGGNSGIGYETTRQLALRNARVYITSRSEQRVNDAITKMQQEPGGGRLDLHFLQCDLQDLASVRAAAANFLQRESRLDVLINNAGVMNAPFQLTKDGFESQWQINYLAVQFFISSLLPLMVETARATNTRSRVRVVNVASDMAFGRASPDTINFEDPNLTDLSGALALMKRYGHSKQAAIRLATEVNDRYAVQGVTAYSCHPGLARTGLQNSDKTLIGSAMRLAMNIGTPQTPLTASYSSLYLATSQQAFAEGQGRYHNTGAKLETKNKMADAWFDDKETNRRLYDETERLMGRYQ